MSDDVQAAMDAVRAKYPDANEGRSSTSGFFVTPSFSNNKIIGSGRTRREAWLDAKARIDAEQAKPQPCQHRFAIEKYNGFYCANCHALIDEAEIETAGHRTIKAQAERIEKLEKALTLVAKELEQSMLYGLPPALGSHKLSAIQTLLAEKI